MYEVPRGIPAKREAVYTVPKQTKGKELKRKKGGNEARGCNTQYIQIVLMRAATKKKSPGWGGIVCQVGTAALLIAILLSTANCCCGKLLLIPFRANINFNLLINIIATLHSSNLLLTSLVLLE
jgi:hypothetical protein